MISPCGFNTSSTYRGHFWPACCSHSAISFARTRSNSTRCVSPTSGLNRVLRSCHDRVAPEFRRRELYAGTLRPESARASKSWFWSMPRDLAIPRRSLQVRLKPVGRRSSLPYLLGRLSYQTGKTDLHRDAAKYRGFRWHWPRLGLARVRFGCAQ